MIAPRTTLHACLTLAVVSLFTTARAQESKTEGARSRKFSSIETSVIESAQESKTEGGAGRSWVRDDADLFGSEAIKKARLDLASIGQSTGFTTLIETTADHGGGSIEEAATTRAREWVGKGVYILIDKKDRGFELVLTGLARDAVPRSRRTAIRDAFLKEFRERRFDEGLAAGVAAIRSALLDARKAAPAVGGGSSALVRRNQVGLTLEGARLILAGAEAKAAEMKLKMNIAVVDDGGHLLAFARMDGGRPASGYTAITKATSAATFRQETGPVPKGTTAPDPLLNLSIQNAAAHSGGKITTLFGGVPVVVEGQVIGGVGVGGGSGEQDAVVAKAGIARFLLELEPAPPRGQPDQKSQKGDSSPTDSNKKSATKDQAAAPRKPSVLPFYSVEVAAKPPREVPHGQDNPPNDPLSPAEAIKKMTVPKGFTVELVASEPDIVNPVAMTFDERGRVWVTESLEYPRRSSGPGRDRVKVLEDTDGDGKADKFSVFADGLNIPSGVAVGHGGVWVANAPDILFLQDTDGDGKADRREVVVTGFGRDDTHELPNTLAWGPDGWLYGWNGVFNPSHIVHRNQTYDFTCAIFRIHPKTRDFEIFCEGTSNPWGIAWDNEGSAFSSACVIDHLWHLTESGYYHRQGGPYPPFTWKIESIVESKHQKAAYCGILFYDSDAYPPEYRGKLYMGNIHGNALNVDSLKRRGSTYIGTAEPDFLSANDAWFMPVSQKTGPDGSIYVLDWYDRYHCYQDANRDPGGIDRLKGRLYRVRHEGTPRRAGFDLARKNDADLTALLGSSNGFDRETARRLLTERTDPQADAGLRKLAFDRSAARRTRMNAVWTLVGRGVFDPEFLLALMEDPDPGFRAWGVRASGNAKKVDPAVRRRLQSLANDDSPDVQLQVAVAARKVEGLDPVALLVAVASACKDDPLIPRIVWQNLHPLLKKDRGRIVEALEGLGDRPGKAIVSLTSRSFEKVLATDPGDLKVAAGLLGRVIASGDAGAIRQALDSLYGNLREGGRDPKVRASRARALGRVLAGAASEQNPDEFFDEYLMLLAYCGDIHGRDAASAVLHDATSPESNRVHACEILTDVLDPLSALKDVKVVFADPSRAGSVKFRGQVLSALGRLDGPKVAAFVLEIYPKLEPELKPRAVELLSQRSVWGQALMEAVGKGIVPASSVNLNQVRRLLGTKDAALTRLVKERWGTIREGRNPGREQVIGDVRALLRKTPGDARTGVKVFQRLCAQCHKLYGEGQDVGPEITLNGRSSYEQLLSNVFDPSLVIGSAYQGTTVATTDGRVLTGLLAEKSPERVVLKMPGGKVEAIPAGEVEELKVSLLSLMPEDVEKQLQPQEIADLFAYLTLDRPPDDPKARRLPGARELATKVETR